MTSTAARWTIAGAILAISLAGPARAADYTLRIQTYYPSESAPGQVFLQFVDDIETMADGRLEIEAYTSSQLVKTAETFDAASTGILDCDMTGSTYVTGKDAGFQFFGDVMGGYDKPLQQYAWLDLGGGRAIADELYGEYDMKLIGLWMQPPEALSANKPIRTMEDLKGWKYRTPPGMQPEIFSRLGASPVVMDFGEVFTALSSGVVDGADYSTLNANKAVGLYEHTRYATYPGFHSMPADHLACNKTVWEELPADIQRIIEVALKAAALDMVMRSDVADHKAARELEAQGVELIDWSPEERAQFRSFSRDVWQEWATKSPYAGRAVDSHLAFMRTLGLVD